MSLGTGKNQNTDWATQWSNPIEKQKAIFIYIYGIQKTQTLQRIKKNKKPERQENIDKRHNIPEKEAEEE